MDSTTTQADQLFDYDVTDSMGNKIGSVDGVWVDDATNLPEFVSVKTGWLFGHSHLLPIEQGQIDSANNTIQVPYSSDQVKNGPAFSTDAELSPSDEQQIYDYYATDGSTETSPTGYTGGTTDTNFQTDNTVAGEGDREITLSQEELQVGKRQVQTGDVQLRKVVRTEHQEVPVELRREEVEIERVPASGVNQVPGTAFQETEIDVPVMEEEPVVAKEAQVTGAVRVNKTATTETRTVGGDVRTEDVEVDGADNGNVTGYNTDQSTTGYNS